MTSQLCIEKTPDFQINFERLLLHANSEIYQRYETTLLVLHFFETFGAVTGISEPELK